MMLNKRHDVCAVAEFPPNLHSERSLGGATVKFILGLVVGCALGWGILSALGHSPIVLTLGDIPRSWEMYCLAAVGTALAMIPIAMPIWIYRTQGQEKTRPADRRLLPARNHCRLFYPFLVRTRRVQHLDQQIQEGPQQGERR